MKTLISVFTLLWAVGCADRLYAQALDSAALKRIGEQLVQLEIANGEGSSVPGDNCLRDTDGHFLSCYYAESSAGWISDFNNDGIPDVVFRFTDEGLGGGGNAYGFEYRVLLLDRKRNIAGQQSIFGGGKFSYGHLEIDEVSRGKIYATCHENPMSRISPQEGGNLKSVPVVFSFRDGRIEEENYQRCPLAAMQKQIFRKDKGLQRKTALRMDDLFNEEYTERVAMTDGSEFVAVLSGCEDLDISFSRTVAYKKSLKTDKAAIKQELLRNLAFLKENTLFKTLAGHASAQLEALGNELIRTGESGGAAIHLLLPGGWKAHLFVSGNEEQGSFITIRFEKPKNAEVMDFWESLESRRRLN